MSASRGIVSTTVSLILFGCGTYVPDTQEFPGNKLDQQKLVQAIVKSVHCEVKNAITDLYFKSLSYPDMRPFVQKIYNWGLQLTLSLKTEEKTAINPIAVWTPPGTLAQTFTLGASAIGSADAIRTEKLYFYYKVPELIGHPCPAGQQPRAPVTSLLIQSDLKFADWLYDQLPSVATDEYSLPTSDAGPLKQNVFYYEVSFEVVSAGGITPAWKLVQSNFNQTGTLFAATRDRTHDLSITMGPGDSNGLKGQALNTQLASDIGIAVSNSVKSLRLP
jgi:hypothetical protein